MAHGEQEKNARDVPAVAARIAVALVFALNVQCALQFVLWPGAFAGAYELSGVAGEAAVRSLKDRSREKVDALIEKLINERMQLRQFEDCDITMKELTIIRNTITNNLTGVYHSRIEYPKVKLEEIKTEESE